MGIRKAVTKKESLAIAKFIVNHKENNHTINHDYNLHLPLLVNREYNMLGDGITRYTIVCGERYTMVTKRLLATMLYRFANGVTE